MAADCGAHVIDELHRAGHGSAKANAIVSAAHIVVHGLGDGNDWETLLVQAQGIAQSVVTTNGDKRIQPQ